jgi:periplasmic copper chaperone A
MKSYLSVFLVIATLQFSGTDSAKAGEIVVHPVSASNVWARETVPAQEVAGVYMNLTSIADIRLVSATSPRATAVEIHEMSMVDNVMQMRELSGGLKLTKGSITELNPGGVHLMLTGIKSPLKAGSVVPVTLAFETKDKKRSTIKVEAIVRERASGASKSNP